MKICKCNLCGKVLEPTKDKYYTIGEVSFHAPNTRLTRLVFDKSDNSEFEGKHVESWLSYCDLDFCEDCFEQVNIKRFL